MNIDRKKITIFQKPNAPLLVWIVCLIAARIFKTGYVHTFFDTLGFIAISVWAIWEIVSGVNIFRRLLGLVVLSFVLLGRF